MVARSLAGVGGKADWLLEEYDFYFRVMGMFWNCTVLMAAQPCKYTKNHPLKTFKWYILFHSWIFIYPKKRKYSFKKIHVPQMFIAAFLLMLQYGSNLSVLSTDQWIKKMWHKHTHPHTQWNIRHKKNEILPFAAAWMDLDTVKLSELSQTKTNILSSHL